MEWTDEKILEEILALRTWYGLKRTMRYRTTRDFSMHNESVAEHLSGINYLMLYFLPLEDPDRKLDVAKISSIITFHDFGEILHGDVPTHLKTDKDEQREREDAHILFQSLPESLREVARESWEDYEKQVSREAQFVFALDKIESLFELLDPVNERSIKRLKATYEDFKRRKLLTTTNFPVIHCFSQVIGNDMLARDLFWKND